MDNKQLQELIDRINDLAAKQNAINEELKSLKRSVFELYHAGLPEKEKVTLPPAPQPIQTKTEVQLVNTIASSTTKDLQPSPEKKPKEKTKWEEFIGTNLLNKIGIAILVFGISIGVKYAIDHQMLNPLTRVILGYLAGASIIFFALRLKKNYEAFSAVLLSGGMASLYFITFAAYDFYGFIPQTIAFFMMVVFTAFTVFAAMQYNLQVIAVIGLVGAYGVPFLLSDGSGRVAILFSYMSIINIGILYISFLRNWRILFWSAFSLSWLIFSVWAVGDYSEEQHFWLALTFSTVFFVIFYIAFLVSQRVEKTALSINNVIAVLLNCTFYFAWGYYFISNYPDGELYLGLFTLFNAVIHFAVCVFIHRQVRESMDAFYFVAGLVLAFITIAVPVQLEGNWVTFAWALQSALLFWLGRAKGYPVYELLSYPLAVLTLFSLMHDWQQIRDVYFSYNTQTTTNAMRPLLNIGYFTSLIVTGMFGFMWWLSRSYTELKENKWLQSIAPLAQSVSIILGIGVFYVACYQQITIYFQNQYLASAVTVSSESFTEYNHDWLHFQTLWIIHYSVIFFAGLWLAAKKIQPSRTSELVVFALNVIVILSFLSAGLDALTKLKDTYLTPSRFYTVSVMNVGIRYVSYLFVTVSLFVNFRISAGQKPLFQQWERLFCHFTILTLLGSLLLSILDLSGITDGDLLWLSILWGVYALYLIIWGFSKDQKFLRVAGIALFGVTILKLFFFDLRDMGTIAKTIVLMILGVLLLVASFVYNKRKKKDDLNQQEQTQP